MYKTCIPNGESSMYQSNDFLFIYILTGNGETLINEKKFRADKGNGFIIARNKQITFKSNKSSPLLMVHVHLSESEIENYLLHNAPLPSSHESNDMNCIQQIPNHLLLRIFAVGIETGINQGFHANARLTFLKVQECINILIFLRPELHFWFLLMNHPQKIDLKEFMERYFRYNRPLEQLAQAAGRSLSTFRRDFLKEFGTTPSKWLLTKRLNEAYKLITQEKRKPSSFLSELGFESFSHFSRSFKTLFGIQPTKLLKKT